MFSLKQVRLDHKISQRTLASLSRTSFRTIQLLESGGHDAKLSTLQNVATALGYQKQVVATQIEALFDEHPDSLRMISQRLAREGEKNWQVFFFDFVDAFRRTKDPQLVAMSPGEKTSDRFLCLFASAVEALCAEADLSVPSWCAGILPLDHPWFVSGIENLKAMALVESPVYFRQRNIFVLGNFLDRT